MISLDRHFEPTFFLCPVMSQIYCHMSMSVSEFFKTIKGDNEFESNNSCKKKSEKTLSMSKYNYNIFVFMVDVYSDCR